MLQFVKSFREVLFFICFKEATTRDLLHGVFYFNVIASLLEFVVSFCCQNGFLFVGACHLVLKNVELEVGVGDVICLDFYHRRIFKQLLTKSPRDRLDILSAKFFTKDLGNSQA